MVALGNPFGLGESVSSGILSSKRRAVPKENEELRMENWLQTDALINPGNSGGPLVDLRGDLIGINVAIYQGAQGIGFAIPIKEVREALADVFNPETASRWFGAHVSVTPPLVVKKIDPDSPAEEAGLKVGDDDSVGQRQAGRRLHRVQPDAAREPENDVRLVSGARQRKFRTFMCGCCPLRSCSGSGSAWICRN